MENKTKIYKRGDKVYLDEANTQEAEEITYILSFRDAMINMVEYVSEEGYGNPTKVFKCYTPKSESVSIYKYELINYRWVNILSENMMVGDLEILLNLLTNGDGVTTIINYNNKNNNG